MTTISLISSCGQTESSQPNAYIVEIDGKAVIWADGDLELGPLEAPPVESGVLLERTASDQGLDNSAYQLIRAFDARLPGGSANNKIIYADLHPENADKVLSYRYRLDVRRQGNTADVYLLLTKESTYKNAQGATVKLVSLGTANFQNSDDRAYVRLDNKFKVAGVRNGIKRGSWAVYHNGEAYRATGPENFDGLCRDATQLAGQMAGQSNAAQRGICKPKPAERDLCNGDPSTGDCIPPAPSGTAPFTDSGEVWDLNLEMIKERQYRFHLQAAVDAAAEVLFVSRSREASVENNATQCKDYFEARGWTIGARVNRACDLTPAPSPTPKNGKLACRISVKITDASNYQERVCYVKGLFTGEYQHVETVQFIKPHNKI